MEAFWNILGVFFEFSLSFSYRCLSEIAELDEKDRAAEAEKQQRAKRRRELEDMRNAQTEGRKRLRGELDKLRAALDD